MTDNELLLAISNMLDPIREDIHDLKGEMRGVKSEIKGLKGEMQGVKSEIKGLKGEMQGVKSEIRDLKEDVQMLKEDVQDLQFRMKNVEYNVKELQLNQENKIIPWLDEITSCYTSTYDRYKDSVETYDSMKKDFFVVKKVVEEHSKQLQMMS